MRNELLQLWIIQAWQITALAIVVAVVVKLAAKNRPHLAHALWVLVLIKCVTPPLWGHSLGVFSQLQARLMPDESASLPDVIDPPASGPVAIAETLVSAPEIDVPDSGPRQLETYEPDDLFPMADTEMPLDASFVSDRGTDLEQSASQSQSIEGDEPVLLPEEFEANIAQAEPAVSVESAESNASWLRPGWLLPCGLVAGAIMTLFIMVFRCLRCLRLIHRHRTTEFDDQLHARIQHLSGQLRIRRIPQVIVSDVLFGPAVLGLLRHTIILPRCLLTSVETLMDAESGKRKAEARDAEQHTTTACNSPLSAVGFPLSFLDPILAHELLHIRRGDLRTGTLQAIAQSLWWFHPAVWLSNRWLSREAERCCDEQVIAELGCSPAQYARSLLSVIECKHQLQPIPVFPGMKPVEITTQRMERIMSLRNGLKKRTPLWCWLMILALAFVVLPGAVAKPTADEKPPAAIALGEDAKANEAVVASTPPVEVSTKTYEAGDLLERLAEEQGISTDDAKKTLIDILEKAAPPVTEVPKGSPAPPKVAASPSISASPSQPTSPVPRRLSSISLDGDQLVIVQSDVGHGKLKEEIDRFREFGFRRFQVTARFIIGPAEEINTLMSTLKFEALFSKTAETPVVETPHKAAEGAKPELPAVATYQMGTGGIVSRDQARAMEELARSKTDCLTVECPQVQAFNGQTAMTHVGETKPYIVGFNENDEPIIRTIVEGLAFHVTPTALDNGHLRLQCVRSLEGVAQMQSVSISRRDSESPQRIQLPAIASKRVQTTVELDGDQTLYLSGLTTTQDGKSQAVLVVLDAIPIPLKPLTALIRLDESFIPSPEGVLTADTVLAYVADKKITVADVANGLLSRLEKDTNVTPEQRQQILLDTVVQHLPGFLYDEVVLHEVRRTLPLEKESEARKSLEPFFSALLENIAKDMGAKDTDDLERLLQEKGFSIESMRESFVRRQFVVGYSQSMPAGSPMQDRAAIETYCRQLLFEARLRQKISVEAKQSFSLMELLNLGEERGITISRIGISDEDLTATVATDILDLPFLEVIKAIVEPHGFQVAVGQQEVVLTAKPMEQPIAVTVEPGSFRVEALPLPDSIRKSSDPLVKLVWDARDASRRRLLMTDQRTPWQLMNGLAALRRDFLIRQGDEAMAGLDWLQNSKEIPGDPWFQKTEHGGQPDPQPAPVWFDDHAQQFVATLAMNDVPLSAEFRTKDGPITMGDMIKHLQMTVSKKNLSPWTLCALSKHLSPDAKWVNADSEEWSLEKLLQIEVDKLDQAATQPMVLFAIACARNQYLKTGQRLRGVWQQADQEILDVIQHDESMSPRYRPLFAPYRYPHVKRETRLPHIRPVSSTDPASQKKLFLEALRVSPYQPQYFDTHTFSHVPRGQMLMFFVTAVPDEQLQAVWLRNAIEVAANELLAGWGNAEIRSPFYETTHALSLYLERVAVAGAATTVDQTAPFTVQVKGQVRNPGVYQAPADQDFRVTDAVQLAGGATDETAKTVYVIRNRGKNPQPTILQIGYNGAERGAEPNIFLAPGDEVLVQSPEFVKQSIADSIRLDDSFVLSPDMPITGSSVIVYVNDRQITVERFIGSFWSRLEETPEITETLKRRVALEAIASGLPEFVFQQLTEHYFHVDTAESLEDDSMPLREVTVKQFAEILEKVSKFDADPRTQARMLLALRARDSRSEFLLRQQRGFVRGMPNDSVENNRAIVIRHVQELLTTACLRNAVSLDFTNASLSDVVQVLEKEQYINVEINSLHAQIGSRIFDKPATVEFHCKNRLLGDAIKDIVEPFGMTTHLHGDSVLIQFADSQEAMARFRSLPGPPSFGVFGIVKNTGWQVLAKEIRLLDALAIAGGVANPEGVSIEITNPDIIAGKAVPVSMSLRILQNDESGKLNRIVKDGDIISVTRNGSADALPAKESGAGVINGKGVNGDAGPIGTVRFDQPSNVADPPGRSPAPSEIQDNVAGRYDGPPARELMREPKLDVPDKLLVPERPMPPEIEQSSDPLLKLVWEARESSRRRLLTTDQHTPWQLMHGVLGLRQDFLVKHDGKIINGLEWIQSGPTYQDEAWFQKTAHGGQAHPFSKPYVFDGHINQFAAILASCRLPLNAQFGTPDGPITMQDLITNAQMTANEKEEVSWTLSLLSRYLPPDAKWVNAKGEEWSIERLVKVAVGKSLHGAPCGGTCGLFALAVARHEYQRSGKPLEGVWLEAEQKVRRYIQTARLQQNPNGTLSSNYFRGREYKQDFDQRLASSGALLQFLLTAVPDEQLKEDWLRRAVEATANDLMTNRKAFVSCSPLFETTNAFSIYLDRISVSAVTVVKPDSKEDSLAERLVLMKYPVADLVFREVSVVSAVSRSTDSAPDATHDVVPAAALTSGTEAAPDKIVDVPAASQQAKALTSKADLTPLVELIKASVQPDSWHERGTVAVDEATLSLIIQQTAKAHEEIQELLTQLRDAQDQSVQIPCQVMHLTKESQTKWLEEQCSLHSLEPGIRWALLPRKRCESFTQALLEQKPEVLSRPRIIAISGQATTISVGQSAVGGMPAIGVRLEVTPHVLPYSNVVRLQHSFSIGEFTNPMPRPIESLVGSSQTLLLLVSDPVDSENPDAARSRYLLMMTPEHVEEEEAVSGATPKESLDASTAVSPPKK